MFVDLLEIVLKDPDEDLRYKIWHLEYQQFVDGAVLGARWDKISLRLTTYSVGSKSWYIWMDEPSRAKELRILESILKAARLFGFKNLWNTIISI